MTPAARRTRSTTTAPLLLALAIAACTPVTYTHDYDRGVSIGEASTWAWEPMSAEDAEALARISPFLERRLEAAVDSELTRAGFTRVADGPADYFVSAYPILPTREAVARAGAIRPGPRVALSFGVSVGSYPGWGYPYGAWGYPYAYGWGRPYRYYPYRYYRPTSYWGPTYGYGAPVAWSFGVSSVWGLPYFGTSYVGSPYFGWPSYAWTPGLGYTVVSSGGYPSYGVVGAGDRGPGSLVIDVIDAETNAVVWQGVAAGALLDMPPPDAQDAYIEDVVRRTLESFPPDR